MNYYIDTEFLEGPQKEKFPISLFRKETKPTIDLISIGIVAEDTDCFSKRIGKTDKTIRGREYYAISKEFNLDEAWNRFDISETESWGKNDKRNKIYWIRENVLKPIWIDLFLLYEVDFTFLKGKAYDAFEQELKNGEHDKLFTFKSFKALVNRYGKTNEDIADEIVKFVYPNAIYKDIGCKSNDLIMPNCADSEKPKFYAYYADYDWVAFCWLFGKMIDLPNGFPMYCNDLKQMLDERVEKMSYPLIGAVSNNFEDKLKAVKKFNDYPKQENEHSAICDARFNRDLHKFLNNL